MMTVMIIIVVVVVDVFEKFDVLYDEQSLWYIKFLYYCYKH